MFQNKPKRQAFLVLLLALLAPLLALTAFPDNTEYSKEQENDPIKLENPITVDYLKKKLKGSGPQLVLTPSLEKNLKRKIKSDPLVANYYAALQLNAQQILKEPLLTRAVIGRRLLGTSREMLYRMNVLGMVYRVERDSTILARIDEELKAVSSFTDWNPSHFLDVAEMATAVALAVDWAGDDLPAATVQMAKAALMEKGIHPSYEGNMGWINGTNNWNQVCNGGMIAAALIIADEDPELAAKTISRSLDGLPHALEEYGPDGVYPEGSTYWSYGTSFSVLTSAMLESAFGSDFGIENYPAFKESADFRVLSVAPSGWFYNYADCGDMVGMQGDVTLAWFAQKTNNPLYLEKDKFLISPEEMGKLSRLSGVGLIWLSQFEPRQESHLPLAWKGEGSNPIVIFRSPDDDPAQYYFGGKGGKATVSHGNMDAGSFIWEVNGVRWVIDPGNQSYNELEITGFDLWSSCQDCERWTLLTKNNFGHSTLTVNDELHVNNGFAPLLDFMEGEQPRASFDLSAVFGDNLASATRSFVKPDNRSIVVEDKIQLNKNTQSITWQLMTQADVALVPGGAVLTQEGKSVKLEHLSHPDLQLSVISLDPAPLELDRQMENLKRLELRIPAYLMKNNKGSIRVRMVAMD